MAIVFSEEFTYPVGLLTNEYAFWNPTLPGIFQSSNWSLNSGSLFVDSYLGDTRGYTGIPDSNVPNIDSTSGNNSNIFRAIAECGDVQNMDLSFNLHNLGIRPAGDSWDGIHAWLHYRSEEELYCVTLNRRDNAIVIKKKVPGGPSNGGTYHQLGIASYRWYPKLGQSVKITTRTNPTTGFVTIAVYMDGVRRLLVTDNGSLGGAPLAPGKVGVRGDFCRFYFDNFKVKVQDLVIPV